MTDFLSEAVPHQVLTKESKDQVEKRYEGIFKREW